MLILNNCRYDTEHSSDHYQDQYSFELWKYSIRVIDYHGRNSQINMGRGDVQAS